MYLDANSEIVEKNLKTEEGEETIALVIKTGAFAQTVETDNDSPAFSQQDLDTLISERVPVKDLTLIPYHYRSNRGGRGQMRVGFSPAASVM